MIPDVDHNDRSIEFPDEWHPQYESVTRWLDALAPVDEMQKLRNRPKWRRKHINMGDTAHSEAA